MTGTSAWQTLICLLDWNGAEAPAQPGPLSSLSGLDQRRLPPRWLGGKVSASRAADLGSIPAFPVDLNLCPGRVMPVTRKIGTPVTNLPDAWRYRVSSGTGWSGVSTL